MFADGWKILVVDAVRQADDGDPSQLDLLAQLLEEQDQAKQVLRDAGIVCTGMGIKETAEAAASRLDAMYDAMQYEE